MPLLADMKMKDLVRSPLKLGQEHVSLLGEDVPLLARQEDRDLVLPEDRELLLEPREDMPGLPQGSLLVVERVEEAEDERLGRPDGLEKRQELRRHGGLHLVAGKPARDVDAREEEAGVELAFPGEAGEEVDVKAVAAVDNRQGVRQRREE